MAWCSWHSMAWQGSSWHILAQPCCSSHSGHVPCTWSPCTAIFWSLLAHQAPNLCFTPAAITILPSLQPHPAACTHPNSLGMFPGAEQSQVAVAADPLCSWSQISGEPGTSGNVVQAATVCWGLSAHSHQPSASTWVINSLEMGSQQIGATAG